MAAIVRLLSGVLVFVSACGGKSTDSDTDPASTGPGTSTSDSPTSTNDGEATASTQPEQTATGETADEGATTAASGAGTCEEYCAYQQTCHEEPLEYCLPQCEADLAAMTYIGPACEAEHGDYLGCIGALTCEDGEAGEQACAGAGDEPAPPSTACVLPTCASYCGKLDECDLNSEGEFCAPGCSYAVGLGVAESGDGCGDALQALYTCLTALPCEDIGGETACEAEQMAIEPSCP